MSGIFEALPPTTLKRVFQKRATSTTSTSFTSSTTTATTSTSSSTLSSSSSASSLDLSNSAASSDAMPSISTTTTSMPTISMPGISTTQAYTTPSVTVPSNNDNPYIFRETHPSGTVFIAVGAIVAAIIFGFILFHVIKSLAASRLAKRRLGDIKGGHQTIQSNQNPAFGMGGVTPTSTMNLNSDYQSSVARIPLLSHNRSKSALSGFGDGYPSTLNFSNPGDSSNIYGIDSDVATSQQDLTNMFISPTAEVMRHKKTKSAQFGSSMTLNNSSQPMTQLIPNLYINEENNSDYSISSKFEQEKNQKRETLRDQSSPTPRTTRKTIPSMYLEDLIDKD